MCHHGASSLCVYNSKQYSDHTLMTSILTVGHSIYLPNYLRNYNICTVFTELKYFIVSDEILFNIFYISK